MKKKIAQNITNLLESYMDDGFFSTPHRNRILQEYLLDLRFNDKYTSLVSNSFSLLSKIDLSKEFYGPLTKVIINYLRIENDLAWNHLKEFCVLLIKKGQVFTSDQLTEIFQIAIERDEPNNHKYEELIKSSSEALNKFYPDIKISNKQLVKKAIGNCASVSKWIYVSYLLLVTDDSCRTIISGEIEEMFDLKLDFDLYEHLIRKKLFDYRRKDYFERLVEKIKTCEEVGFTNVFKDGEPIFTGYTFFNFILLINILKIDRESDLLKNFNNISPFQAWLLNPLKFDYSNFDVKWILASDKIHILNSLKGIEKIQNAVEAELKREFNPTLSEIYYKYLL